MDERTKSAHRIVATGARAYGAALALTLAKRIWVKYSKRTTRRMHPGSHDSAAAVPLLNAFAARTPLSFLALFGGFAALDELILQTLATTTRSVLTKVANGPSHQPIRIKTASDATTATHNANDNKSQTTHNNDSVLSFDARRRATAAAAAISSVAALLLVHPSQRMEYALFAAVQATDACISSHRDAIQSCLDSIQQKRPQTAVILRTMANNADTVAFQLACWEIMYAWFYSPESLPRGYQKWISQMASMDLRLLDILRGIRSGRIVYGKDLGHQHMLRQCAADLGLPASMGDPVNGPLPCIVIHGGVDGCIRHKIVLWISSFLKALRIYLPVHILPLLTLKLRKLATTKSRREAVIRACLGAAQSSSFLATFIALIWTAICSVRHNTNSPDTPFGPTLGSWLAGWSLFIERPGNRRRDLALYCIPKAISSLASRTISPIINQKTSRHLRGIAEMAIFCISMTSLVDSWRRDKTTVRPAVRGIFQLFGI